MLWEAVIVAHVGVVAKPGSGLFGVPFKMIPPIHKLEASSAN